MVYKLDLSSASLNYPNNYLMPFSENKMKRMQIRKFEFTYLTDDSLSCFFDIVGSKGNDYVVRVILSEGKIITDSCDCVFGSIYRFGEKYGGDKRCRHILACLKLLEYLGYVYGEQITTGDKK